MSTYTPVNGQVFHSLTEAFAKANVALEARDVVTGVEAGRRVGYSLPLPAEPVSSPMDYYLANCAAIANNDVSAMNETAVMDYAMALKAARLYWMARYDVLYNPESEAAMGIVRSLVDQQLATPDFTAVVISSSAEAMKDTFDQVWGKVAYHPVNTLEGLKEWLADLPKKIKKTVVSHQERKELLSYMAEQDWDGSREQFDKLAEAFYTGRGSQGQEDDHE